MAEYFIKYTKTARDPKTQNRMKTEHTVLATANSAKLAWLNVRKSETDATALRVDDIKKI